MYQKEPEILGIFFSEDYKRFEKGTFIPLSSKYNGYFYEENRKLIISENKEITEYNSIIREIFNLDIEIKGIIGNNGAGKSTILKIIKLFLEGKILLSSNNDLFNLDNQYFSYKLDELYSPGFYLITNYDLLGGKNRKYQNTIDFFEIKNSSYQEAKGYKGEDKLDVAIKNEDDSSFLINNILKEILGFYDNKIEKNIKIKTHGNSRSKKDSENMLYIFESITNYLSGVNRYNKNNFYHYVFDKIKSEKFNNNDELFNIFLYFYWFFYFSWIGRSNKEYYSNYLNLILNNGIIYDFFIKISEILDSSFFQNEKIENNIFNSQKNSYNILEYYFTKKIKIFNRKYDSINEYLRLMKKHDIDYKLSIEVFRYLQEHFSIELYEGGDNGKYYMYFEFKYEDFINDIIKNDFIKEEILNNYLVSLNIKLLDKSNKTFLIDSFSNGEKQMIKIFLQIKHLYEELNNKEEDNNENEYSNQKYEVKYKKIFILLDEPDESLHLEWQRKFIYYLLSGLNNIFKDYNGKIYIYFATHSPFIISDLSKESIIFLEREKDINNSLYNGFTTVKAFEEIKQESNITINNTFLGNIPELIRGGFFLEENIGELGKHYLNNKIKEIKNIQLKNKDLIIDKNNYQKIEDNNSEITEIINNLENIVGDEFILEYLFLKNIVND